MQKLKIVGKKYLKPNEIIRLKADANYTEISLTNGNQIIISKTLKELEKTFCTLNFYRTHKSYMINLEHIDSVQINGENNNNVTLKNNLKADISRRRKINFLNTLRQYKLT